MTNNIPKKPPNIDLVNYNYLINKPKSEINLIDFMAISVLEEKYPELKFISPNKKV